MLIPYLFCFPLSLVAANPVFQRIPIQIPAQSWPAQPCQTCPTQTCPNVSRPAPCQTCQIPYQNLFNPVTHAHQPINYPYNKPATQKAGRQIPPEILSQLVFRKLLTPQPQSQNSATTQSQAPVKCNQCEAQTTVPNIVNNYIIVPPEYFTSNKTESDKDTVKKTKGKRRRQQRQRKQEDRIHKCDVNKEEDHDVATNSQNETPCPCENDALKSVNAAEDESQNNSKSTTKTRRQQRQRKQGDAVCKCDVNKDVDHDVVTNSQNETPCDKDALKSVNPPEDESKNNSKSTIKTIIDNLLPQNVSADAETKVSKNDTKIKSCNEEEQCNKKTENKNQPAKSDKPRRRNRDGTKKIEEVIIRDFCKKHPMIPEEIARSLLKKIKQQVENRHNSYTPYNYPSFGHSDFWSQMFYPPHRDSGRTQSDRIKSDRGSRRRKPNASPRRYKKPKEDLKENPCDCDKKSEKLVELKPKIINIETETITTEKITTTTESKHKDSSLTKESETQMENPSDFIEQLQQIKAKFAKLNEIETTTVNHNKYIEVYPELGKEDIVPNVSDNGLDDYYPDFRGDNIALYKSDEERDKKNRYHYTTDRNERFNNKKDLKTRPTESEESFEKTKDESVEIRFKIPPSLELPDFETKQINRYLELDDLKTVKSYSDANADSRIPEVEMKPAKVFTKDKTGRTNVETVYGRSRVVKYGQDTEGAGTDPVITYYLPEEAMTEERILLPDGEKAVVVAKSIHDRVEDWFKD